MTQDELREVYLQEVEGRLHAKNEDLAWTGLCRWLDLKSQWGHLTASSWDLTDAGPKTYSFTGDDPVCIAAYRIWLKAHLAARGHHVFVQSNPVENRVLMAQHAARLQVGKPVGEDLELRLRSPDPLVRSTALGDIARGWV